MHVSLTPETDKLLNKEAFAQMKKGVRIVNCARGELVDEGALKAAIESGKVAGAALDVFAKEPTDASYPLFALDAVLATPHIGGSTEEAQEIVGVRIAEQMVEYLQNGVAINAVNMPALSPEQYKAAAPYIDLAERLGNFAAHLVTGNPDHDPADLFRPHRRDEHEPAAQRRPGGRAGPLDALRRPTSSTPCRSPPSAAGTWRKFTTSAAATSDTIRLEVETDSSVTTVEGAVVLGKPRLMQVDGIYCEAALTGHAGLHEESGRARRDRPCGDGAADRTGSTSRTSRWAAAIPASRWKRSPWFRPTRWCRRTCWIS